MEIIKEMLTDRLVALEGDENSLKNQSIRYITSQQFKLIVDLESWRDQDHATLDQEQIDGVAEGMEKRKKLLAYIYTMLS